MVAISPSSLHVYIAENASRHKSTSRRQSTHAERGPFARARPPSASPEMSAMDVECVSLRAPTRPYARAAMRPSPRPARSPGPCRARHRPTEPLSSIRTSCFSARPRCSPICCRSTPTSVRHATLYGCEVCSGLVLCGRELAARYDGADTGQTTCASSSSSPGSSSGPSASGGIGKDVRRSKMLAELRSAQPRSIALSQA